MFNFVSKRKWYFILSSILLLAGIISLAVTGLNLGLDFSPGSSMDIYFNESIVNETQLRAELDTVGHGDARIQYAVDSSSGDDYFYVRTREINVSEKDDIKDALQSAFGPVDIKNFEYISPEVAAETVRNAGYAVLAAVVGILLYITWAFRKLPKPFHYGFCAIIALFHDMLIMIGMFSILGWAANIEVNSMFIIAALTILGYSVNDTIVVFDRIRENLLRGISDDFGTTVNVSINESLGRSLATSITTLLVLLALYLFGGATISTFILALIIGVVSGTYSSIFIASQVLVSWEIGTFGRIYKKIKSLFTSEKAVIIENDE